MYALKDSDEGVCQKCNKDLKLLTHKGLPDGYPAFLICFGCEDVTQVDGDNGMTVQYKRGKRRKFARENKIEKPDAKMKRLRDHQAAKRQAKGKS